MVQDEIEFDSIEEALSALRDGRNVIVVDAAERENEGDFVCAAESITPQQVEFMLKHGGGVMCVPMVSEVADRLRLTPLVDGGFANSPHCAPFLTLVDHRNSGVRQIEYFGRVKSARSADRPLDCLEPVVDATATTSIPSELVGVAQPYVFRFHRGRWAKSLTATPPRLELLNGLAYATDFTKPRGQRGSFPLPRRRYTGDSHRAMEGPGIPKPRSVDRPKRPSYLA